MINFSKKNSLDINKRDVFVILPAYNEDKHVVIVINSLKKQGLNIDNIILVDDGSKDFTMNKAFDAGAVVLRHQINLGKGAAVKTGCDYAVLNGAKILVLMDSDGQHNACEINKFLSEINNKKVDVVFGFREFNEKMPFTMRFGNLFLTFVSRVLFGMNIKDTQSGFRCFTSSVYEKIRWHSYDYGMESEMIAKISKHKLTFSQIPIDTIYHDAHKGTTPIDGIKIFLNMLRLRFF